MDSEILKAAGQAAGIGGVALGTFLLLFRDIIRKNIFPTLSTSDAYRLLLLISVAIWSVGVGGIVAWVYVNQAPPLATLSQILRQSEEYDSLFNEYKRIRDELERKNSSDNQRKLTELQKELGVAKDRVDTQIKRIDIDSNAYPGISPDIISSWRACIKSGAGGTESTCSDILRSGMRDYRP